jgi:hypothetical protein
MHCPFWSSGASDDVSRAAIIGSMTYQMNFWLVRSDSCLRLCAAIPPLHGTDDSEAKPPIVTYESPGAFFSRLDTAVFEREKVEQMKTTVIQAIGTLGHVFTVAAIDVNPAQLGKLCLQDQMG